MSFRSFKKSYNYKYTYTKIKIAIMKKMGILVSLDS